MGGKEFKKMKKEIKQQQTLKKKQQKEASIEQLKSAQEDNILTPLPKTKKIKKVDTKVKANISEKTKEIKTTETELTQKPKKVKQLAKDEIKKVKKGGDQKMQIEEESTKQTKNKSDEENQNGSSTSVIKAEPLPQIQSQIFSKASQFTTDIFTDLKLSKQTQQALKKLQYTCLTQTQSKILPLLLQKQSLQIVDSSSSGKIVSVLIAAAEQLSFENFNQKSGTGVFIVAPSKKIAVEIFKQAKGIFAFHSLTLGLVMSEMKIKDEALRLKAGVNVLIGTADRLLEHMQNTAGFAYNNLKQLVLVQCESLIELNQQNSIVSINELLPSTKQLVVLTHSNSKQIKEFVKSLSPSHPLITINLKKQQNSQSSNNNSHNQIEEEISNIKQQLKNFEQGYVIIDADKKLRLLFTFLLKQRKDSKIVVFFSSCNSTQFHADLCQRFDIDVSYTHSRQSKQERLTVLEQFRESKQQILFISDGVATSIQQLSNVDWIVSFDPPHNEYHYLSILSQLSKPSDDSNNNTTSTKSIIFLLKEEQKYLEILKNLNLSINEFVFPDHKLSNIQGEIEKLIERNYFLNTSARNAFRSYLQFYTTYHQKEVFNIKNLDVHKVGKSYGFKVPPRVNNLGVQLENKSGRNSLLD